MQTFNVKYFIIFPYIRSIERTANNYRECKTEFLKSSGVKPQQVLKILKVTQ